MSLRPREAVEEASTFSLRSVFSTAPAAPEPPTSVTASDSAALQLAQQPQQPQHAHQLPQQHHRLAQHPPPTKPTEVPFLGLSLGAPAALGGGIGVNNGPGLKFSLPQLKNANTGGSANSAAARAPSAARALPDTGRSLRPGTNCSLEPRTSAHFCTLLRTPRA